MKILLKYKYGGLYWTLVHYPIFDGPTEMYISSAKKDVIEDGYRVLYFY